MYEYHNERAMRQCSVAMWQCDVENTKAMDMTQTALATHQDVNCYTFGLKPSSNYMPVPGPYQSDSLNRKLQQAKKWLASRPDKWSPRFSNVFCSQCGLSFGPGDRGYSHCSSHVGKRWNYETI